MAAKIPGNGVESSGAFAIGATGTASTLAGIPFFSDTTNGSIYTHDVSGTDDTAANNTAFGIEAMDAITTGDNNVAIGYQAGSATTTGGNNTLIGYQAGDALTDGSRNTALGISSLGSETSGVSNTAIGASALTTSNGGSYNTAVGDQAGVLLTTGDNNQFMGYHAGYGNTTGSFNTAIGYQAYDVADTENHNLAIGMHALGGSVAGGEYNTGVGNYTLTALTSGDSNTAVGYYAAASVTTATETCCFGESAGSGITTGVANICIGQNSGAHGVSCTTGSNNIFIGEKISAGTNSNDNQIVIGSEGSTGKGSNTGFINANGGSIFKGDNGSTWATTSDRRIKKNIVDNNIGLEAINKIQVRNFEYRTLEEITDFDNPESAVVKKEGTQLGAIAQEIEEILPDLITETNQGVKTLNADNLTWYLINAVKELSAEINTLKENNNGNN